MLDALRLDLRDIARAACAIAEQENAAGFAEGFRVPHSQGEEALLTAGRLFRQNATSVAGKLVVGK